MLFNLIIIAVVGFSGCAGEAHMNPSDGTARSPDGIAADNALRAVFRGFKRLFQRTKKLNSFVLSLVVFHNIVGKFQYRDIGEHFLLLHGFIYNFINEELTLLFSVQKIYGA